MCRGALRTLSGSFGQGRVESATEPRRPCGESFHALHSFPDEEFPELIEADRIWSPPVWPGSFIFHNQETVRRGQKFSQEPVLVLNKVQRVCHEDPIHWRKAKAGAPKIRQNLMDLDSANLILDPVQRCLVQIEGMNCAAGGQQSRQRSCERSASAAEIAPGLGPPHSIMGARMRAVASLIFMFSQFALEGD